MWNHSQECILRDLHAIQTKQNTALRHYFESSITSDSNIRVTQHNSGYTTQLNVLLCFHVGELLFKRSSQFSICHRFPHGSSKFFECAKQTKLIAPSFVPERWLVPWKFLVKNFIGYLLTWFWFGPKLHYWAGKSQPDAQDCLSHNPFGKAPLKTV